MDMTAVGVAAVLLISVSVLVIKKRENSDKKD